jgi:hypothetical protein
MRMFLTVTKSIMLQKQSVKTSVCLHLSFIFPSDVCVYQKFNLMAEAASTTETSVRFCQTTWRKNPEDSQLHACCPDDLRSLISLQFDRTKLFSAFHGVAASCVCWDCSCKKWRKEGNAKIDSVSREKQYFSFSHRDVHLFCFDFIILNHRHLYLVFRPSGEPVS